MFSSFFPNPRVFFPSAIVWAAVSIAAWYLFARDLGEQFSLGWLIGYPYPAPLEAGISDEAARAATTIARDMAIDIWLYQYMIVMGAIFCFAWSRIQPHPWFRWSVVVSALILFVVWFQVQLDVLINNWFGTFYDLIQKSLEAPHSVEGTAYFAQLVTFLSIAMVSITVAVLNAFVVSHYIFRWRTAMNDYYVAHWSRLRTIEGASQRV